MLAEVAGNDAVSHERLRVWTPSLLNFLGCPNVAASLRGPLIFPAVGADDIKPHCGNSCAFHGVMFSINSLMPGAILSL